MVHENTSDDDDDGGVALLAAVAVTSSHVARARLPYASTRMSEARPGTTRSDPPMMYNMGGGVDVMLIGRVAVKTCDSEFVAERRTVVTNSVLLPPLALSAAADKLAADIARLVLELPRNMGNTNPGKPSRVQLP